MNNGHCSNSLLSSEAAQYELILPEHSTASTCRAWQSPEKEQKAVPWTTASRASLNPIDSVYACVCVTLTATMSRSENSPNSEAPSKSATICPSSSENQRAFTVSFECGRLNGCRRASGRLHLVCQPDGNGLDTRVVCILSVPALMNASDFCLFIRPYADSVSHMRMLQSTTQRNHYMVVLKFRSAKDASAFAKDFHGKHFLNGLINDTCSVDSVLSVELAESGRARSEEASSTASEWSDSRTCRTCDSSNDEGSRKMLEKQRHKYRITDENSIDEVLFPNPHGAPTENPLRSSVTESGPSVSENSSSTSSEPSRGDMSASRDLSAVPSCPVCLERLEPEKAALVTTLCNHTMHVACLAQWDLDSCPICRYAHELTPEASSCMTCGQTRGLWMCVVCAYVGCGVYTNKHANQHFLETQHPFAANVEDCTFWTGDKIKAGQVWDYVSERFVDRLLSSDDGKVVEVSSRRGRHSDRTAGGSTAGGVADDNVGENTREGASEDATTCRTTFRRGRGKLSEGMCSSGAADSDSDSDEDRGFQAAIYASKMDAVVSDYRNRMEQMESEHATQTERLEAEIRNLSEKVRNSDHNLSSANETISSLKAEAKAYKKSFSKRLADLEREAKDLKDRNVLLKHLNESLLRDKASWNEDTDRLARRLAAKEQECAEKDEELRDVMLHLEAQAKVADASINCRARAGSSTDASGGDIIGIGPSSREKLAMKTRRKS